MSNSLTFSVVLTWRLGAKERGLDKVLNTRRDNTPIAAVFMSPVTKTQGRIERVVAIRILEQGGDHARSMELLAKNNLKPLTYPDALSRSTELIERLKGEWFWMSGRGIEIDGTFTFNRNGELVELAGKETANRMIRVWKGSTPLSLYVCPDTDVRSYGRRFALSGDTFPQWAASVVVGIMDATRSFEEGRAALGRLKRNNRE